MTAFYNSFARRISQRAVLAEAAQRAFRRDSPPGVHDFDAGVLFPPGVSGGANGEIDDADFPGSDAGGSSSEGWAAFSSDEAAGPSTLSGFVDGHRSLIERLSIVPMTPPSVVSLEIPF
jgi:hypothetical protein